MSRTGVEGHCSPPCMGWKEIRAVTFDVGGTLIEPWPSVGHVYADTAAGFGLEGLDPGSLNAGFRRAWNQRNGFRYTKAELFELVRQSFGPAATQLSDAFYPAVYDRFLEPGVWRVYPDVRPTLAALADRGCRLGVISNWDERLSSILRTLDLFDPFEAVIVSCDIGHTKPAPQIFHAAMVRLNLPAPAILHVGDSTREDVEGARQAGLKSVRVDRRSAMGDGNLERLLAPLPASD